MDSAAGICCDGELSLAFFFADAGYDLWLNNSRGNKFSRNHTRWDPDVYPEKYWDFSLQEMGLFDQPALFDFVLDKTGVEKVTYIGHSQGCAQMFAAMS